MNDDECLETTPVVGRKDSKDEFPDEVKVVEISANNSIILPLSSNMDKVCFKCGIAGKYETQSLHLSLVV